MSSGTASVMITQRIDDAKYWDWADTHPDIWQIADPNKRAQAIAKIVYDRICAAFIESAPADGDYDIDAYAIAHIGSDVPKKADDMDFDGPDDDDDDDEEEQDTSPTDGMLPAHTHMHMILQLPTTGQKGARLRRTFQQWADAAGVEPQFVSSSGSRKYKWDNMLSYLIHAKDPNKTQYSPDAVYTLHGQDYRAIAKDRKDDWLHGRIVRSRKERKDLCDKIIEQIYEGRYFKLEDFQRDDELTRIYGDFPSKIDAALNAVQQRKARLIGDAIEAEKAATTIIFIEGVSGSGKTKTVAKPLCRALEKRYGWRTDEVPQSNNPFDHYHGSEILLLNEYRGNELEAAQWLQLLDPYDAAGASARYHDKSLVAPLVIIITSITPFNEFFYFTKGKDRKEPMEQFLRRLSQRVVVMPSTADNGDDGDWRHSTVDVQVPVWDKYEHIDTIRVIDHIREWSYEEKKYREIDRTIELPTRASLASTLHNMPQSDYIDWVVLLIGIRCAGYLRMTGVDVEQYRLLAHGKAAPYAMPVQPTMPLAARPLMDVGRALAMRRVGVDDVQTLLMPYDRADDSLELGCAEQQLQIDRSHPVDPNKAVQQALDLRKADGTPLLPSAPSQQANDTSYLITDDYNPYVD